jgi:hypothetical protein
MTIAFLQQSPSEHSLENFPGIPRFSIDSFSLFGIINYRDKGTGKKNQTWRQTDDDFFPPEEQEKLSDQRGLHGWSQG